MKHNSNKERYDADDAHSDANYLRNIVVIVFIFAIAVLTYVTLIKPPGWYMGHYFFMDIDKWVKNMDEKEIHELTELKNKIKYLDTRIRVLEEKEVLRITKHQFGIE